MSDSSSAVSPSDSLFIDPQLRPELPPQVEEIVWPNQQRTILPFINGKEHPSVEAVRRLAQTTPNRAIWPIDLKHCHQPPEELQNTNRWIRAALAVNKPVLLQNFPSKNVWGFTQPSVTQLYGGIRIPISWITEEKRHMNNIPDDDKVEQGPVQEFMKKAADFVAVSTKYRRNGMGDEHPLVHMLRDDDKAWASMFKETKRRSRLSNSEVTLPEVQSVGLDILNARSWIYMAHGGSYIPPSRTSSGFCTWIRVLNGCQIFGLISQKEPPSDATTEMLAAGSMSRQQRFEFFNSVDGKVPLPFSDRLEYSHTFVDGSRILIVPPGYRYDIYIPCASIVVGGDFLCYDTLHLTEFARDYKRALKPSILHTPHPSITRTLCRMAIALKSCITYVRQDALCAIFLMIGDNQHYLFDNYEGNREDQVEDTIFSTEIELGLSAALQLMPERFTTNFMGLETLTTACAEARADLEALQRERLAFASIAKKGKGLAFPIRQDVGEEFSKEGVGIEITMGEN